MGKELHGLGHISQLVIDYITAPKLPLGIDMAKKYGINVHYYQKIIKQYGLCKRRAEYQKQIVEKAISDIKTLQSKTLLKTNFIINAYINTLSKVMKHIEENPKDWRGFSSENFKDVLKAHELLTKEQQLREDKPTDNVQHTVNIKMTHEPYVMGVNEKVIDITPKPDESKHIDAKKLFEGINDNVTPSFKIETHELEDIVQEKIKEEARGLVNVLKRDNVRN